MADRPAPERREQPADLVRRVVNIIDTHANTPFRATERILAALRDAGWRDAAEVERLRAELAELKPLADAWHDGMAAASVERDTLREDLGEARAERDRAKARANEAARLSAEARDQADDLRQQIGKLREHIEIVESDRTDFDAWTVRVAMRHGLGDAPELRDALARYLDELTAERDRLGDKANDLVQVAKGFRAERDALRAELRAEVEAQEGELGDMRAQLSAAEAEVDRLRAEIVPELIPFEFPKAMWGGGQRMVSETGTSSSPESRTSPEFQERITQITGFWFYEGNAHRYIALAERLLDLGLDEDTVVSVLAEAYSIVTDDLGA